MTTNILVCGGRDFRNYRLLKETIDPIIEERTTPIHIISGGAIGADFLAEAYYISEWEYTPDVTMKVYNANWKRYGKNAGPIRNQQMLDEGKPDIVLAFEGGNGTKDMVKRARKASVMVREIKVDRLF